MLASNPLRNSRPELIATMGRRVSFRRAFITWSGPDRKAVRRARFARNVEHIGAIDSVMP